MSWVEVLCVVYISFEVIVFMVGIGIILESYVEDGIIADILDASDFNSVGNIVIGVLLYTLFLGLLPIDICFVLKRLFTWHPQKKEKKLKKTEYETLNARMELLENRIDRLSDTVKSIKKEIFVGDIE